MNKQTRKKSKNPDVGNRKLRFVPPPSLSLEDLARPGLLPEGVGLLADEAHDQVVLHRVLRRVALGFFKSVSSGQGRWGGRNLLGDLLVCPCF